MGARKEYRITGTALSIVTVLALALSSATALASAPVLKYGTPEEVGLSSVALAEVDEFIEGLLSPEADGRFPGMVLLVAKDATIVKHDAYGWAQTYDGDRRLEEPRPMTPDTIFDLASITKVLATTAAVMNLVEQGELSLTEPVSKYVPEFWQAGKGDITLFDLLTHSSGLEQWLPFYAHATNRAEAYDHLFRGTKTYPTGSKRSYSDLGFMTLAAVVERVTDMRLDEYVREEIYEPLGMTDTMFLPPSELKGRIAATSFGNPYEYRMVADPNFGYLRYEDPEDFDGWRDYTLVGEVNDGNAYYAFEGVAGHAGLFSTAYDMAVFGQMMLNLGSYGDVRIFEPSTVLQFTTPKQYDYQGLGWWTERLSWAPRTYGHNGFTGTDIYVDPDTNLIIIVLANRLHPDMPYSGTRASDIARLVYDAIQ